MRQYRAQYVGESDPSDGTFCNWITHGIVFHDYCKSVLIKYVRGPPWLVTVFFAKPPLMTTAESAAVIPPRIRAELAE